MKYILITLLAACQLVAQTKPKAEYLLDENDFNINETIFRDKIKNRDFHYTVYENDTALIGKIFRREDTGKLSQRVRSEIVGTLRKIANADIADSQTIIINFYYKDSPEPKGSCIDHYVSDNAYRKFLKTTPDVVQFFVTEQGYHYRGGKTFEDSYDEIRKNLFKYKIKCGNYIIIRPDGAYFRKLGEYRQDEISLHLKNLIENSR